MINHFEKKYKTASIITLVLFFIPPMTFITLLSFFAFDNINNYSILIPFIANIMSVVFRKKILESNKLSIILFGINILIALGIIIVDTYIIISEGSIFPPISM